MNRILIPLLLLFNVAGFAQPQALFTYETVKVADGVYAFIAHQPGVGLVSGNSVAIIGDDGVLVVDSGQFPSLTKRMIGEIRTLTRNPVRVLVNTHWHGDHNTGNAVYQQEFPDVAIVSTPETRAHFADLRQKFLVSKQMEQFAPVLRKGLATGKTDDGTPLTPGMRKYSEDMLKEIDAALPELKDVKEVVPNQTFANKLSFYLGKRQVDVLFLGRGNTAGDAVVYVPDNKVLVTGDLVVNPVPYAMGSFMPEWVTTLKRLLEIDAEVIVPGHGSVQHDKRYVQLLANLLQSLNSQVQDAAGKGLSLEDTRKKIDLSEFRKQIAGDDPKLNRDFDNLFVQPGVRRAYREAKEGKLNDEN